MRAITIDGKKYYNEFELNGQRIPYNLCCGGNLEEAIKSHAETHTYLGSSFITYHNGVRNENPTYDHFFKSSFKSPIEIYLEERISELNKADADYCKDRWDMTKPANERGIAREFSNQVTFARQELQAVLKHFLSQYNIVPSANQAPLLLFYKIEFPGSTKEWASDLVLTKRYIQILKSDSFDLYSKANILIKAGDSEPETFKLSEWFESAAKS